MVENLGNLFPALIPNLNLSVLTPPTGSGDRKGLAASEGTVQHCLGLVDKCHQLRRKNMEGSVPKLQAVSQGQSKPCSVFCRTAGVFGIPCVVPGLVGPPGNLQMCRRLPSIWPLELESASQPAPRVDCMHRPYNDCTHRPYSTV